MRAIVAVDLNWGIGCNGNLLERIPEDMNFFKEQTLGNVVVMGRETFESLPGKNPLKDRVNIVLSKNKSFKSDNLIVFNSIEEAISGLKDYNNDEIFIIGGESIYKEFLPYCNEVYLTRIEGKYKADRFFPNIDKDKSWILKNKSEVKEYNGVNYSFLKYIKA